MENNWRRFPRLAYNWISTAGAVISLFSGITLLFMLITRMMAPVQNPYLGILVYMIMPMLLVIGLILIPIGMYWNWRSWQKRGKMLEFRWPLVDLNIRSHRNATLIFVTGTLLFVFISTILVYQAYHYTDSVAFCGTTCHKVMKPEYAAYQDSPHARVKCVACHIGPGARWYARSKLSGLYQVYAVLTDVYPRPIPTPIEDLRPARETCETCHWPSIFLGGQQRVFNHFLYDTQNTPWPINMLLKTGGGDPARTRSGIHWHTNPEIRIEYYARDEKRQDIPLVRLIDVRTGKATIYQDVSRPLDPSQAASITPRIMDCMDCHNRPSHDLRSPDYAMDHAIATGSISRSIPDIKRVSVEAMTGKYGSEEQATAGIRNNIASYYRAKHPEFYEQNERSIDTAIQAVQAAYRRNIFPGMNADWSAYENNAGHFIFPGCMRCHDGKHRNESGDVITNDCRSCHVILEQGTGQAPAGIDLRQGQDFRHPVDIGDAWTGGACYGCHTGTAP